MWRYLDELVEVQLGDTGVIIEEVMLGSEQVFVRRALLGGLQGAENKRSHSQVQHDPNQQGQEGGVPHFPPGPPGLKVGAQRPGSGRAPSQDTGGHSWS